MLLGVVRVDTVIGTPMLVPDLVVPDIGSWHNSLFYVNLWMDVLRDAHGNRYVVEMGPGNTENHTNVRIRDTRDPNPMTNIKAVIPGGRGESDAEMAKRLYVLFRASYEDFSEYQRQLDVMGSRRPSLFGQIDTPERTVNCGVVRTQLGLNQHPARRRNCCVM